MGRRVPTGSDERGTTIYDREDDGIVVTRKEAETLTFPKFDGASSFRDAWSDARREIVFRFGRKRLCEKW